MPDDQENVVKKANILISWYKTLCYKALGNRLDNKLKGAYLADTIKQARFEFTPGLYIALILISGTLATVASLFVFILIFHAIIDSDVWYVYVAIMTLIVSGLSFGFLPLSMNMRISNMKVHIDKELPYTLSELSILASTGLSPMEILRRMARRDVNEHMKGEFNRIVYKVDVEGKDIITSLGEAARETPSVNLREMLWDFSTLIHQGGDLDVYLRSKADENLRLKRDIQKEFIEKLSMFSEVYINVTLIGALVGGIGAFLLDATDSTMAGLDGTMALGLLTYILTPLVIMIVLILISMAYARTE